ncbi:MiaB/RimO family radical SAM methylthiotransferase [Coriobacteriia bacterium Es71-Z0120]|uniref:MiaB/RimO family radical SAM methylthiotransferase n=1 Tax=Parvivirga hydrogeniphila TaxID=2939460 RepID=UPI002260EB94|nr:MiaB/RimO family radical SAM methylthiotransferase [Parvivirga hydrogeniphila]MCL4078991.1 MiaB/RimO family radical SAM methylthiotransferase [Parvivirga hydrogeniphila]
MSDRPLRVRFTTLGCKVNRVEAETIAAALASSGVVLVDDDRPDIVVVMACAVTAEASHKARKAVRHALGLPSAPRVVATGCLTAQDEALLAALGPRVSVERSKDAVPRLIREMAGLPEVAAAGAVRAGDGFRTRALVKVQDGCNNRCAYCIVPNTRGAPRSVEAERVLAEVRALVAAGANEVVLTGINIGTYSSGTLDLAGLVREVAATGVRRVRLSSIEPPDVTERFIETVAAIPAFLEHLHIPLQSGSDRTLAAMGRRYTVAEYEATLERLRDAIPGVAVTTDIICGFPGETDDDARESERRVSELGFAKLHVFRFSPRPGTPAAERKDRVPPGTVAARAERMRMIGDAARERFLQQHVGTVQEVLVESVRGGVATGTVRDGARIRLGAPGLRPGDLVHAMVDRVDEGVLAGFLTDQRPAFSRATMEAWQ